MIANLASFRLLNEINLPIHWFYSRRNHSNTHYRFENNKKKTPPHDGFVVKRLRMKVKSPTPKSNSLAHLSEHLPRLARAHKNQWAMNYTAQMRPISNSAYPPRRLPAKRTKMLEKFLGQKKTLLPRGDCFEIFQSAKCWTICQMVYVQCVCMVWAIDLEMRWVWWPRKEKKERKLQN